MQEHYTKRVTAERFKQMKSRYESFLENCDDISKEPTRVFEPLHQKALDELDLIREVSVVLQKKKDEDVRKAAEVAEEEKAKEAEKEETVGEENVETAEVEDKAETEKKN